MHRLRLWLDDPKAWQILVVTLGCGAFTITGSLALMEIFGLPRCNNVILAEVRATESLSSRMDVMAR